MSTFPKPNPEFVSEQDIMEYIQSIGMGIERGEYIEQESALRLFDGIWNYLRLIQFYQDAAENGSVGTLLGDESAEEQLARLTDILVRDYNFIDSVNEHLINFVGDSPVIHTVLTTAKAELAKLNAILSINILEPSREIPPLNEITPTGADIFRSPQRSPSPVRPRSPQYQDFYGGGDNNFGDEWESYEDFFTPSPPPPMNMYSPPSPPVSRRQSSRRPSPVLPRSPSPPVSRLSSRRSSPPISRRTRRSSPPRRSPEYKREIPVVSPPPIRSNRQSSARRTAVIEPSRSSRSSNRRPIPINPSPRRSYSPLSEEEEEEDYYLPPSRSPSPPIRRPRPPSPDMSNNEFEGFSIGW